MNNRQLSRRQHAWALLRTVCVSALILTVVTGCGTTRPAPDIPPVVTRPDPARPPQQELSAELVSFGKLRTVVHTTEKITHQNGQTETVREIAPMLERELVQRDFRLFSGQVPATTQIAQITRDTRAHVVLFVNGESRFVNSTGRFSVYRAETEVRAVRAGDGSLLSVARNEQNGPRRQDPRQAGRYALRASGGDLAETLMEDLVAKSDQLRWSGLIINWVPSLQRANQLVRELEALPHIDHVELLEWDRSTQVAVYEVIHGLRRESDLVLALQQMQGLRVQPTKYQPERMEVFRRIMARYR